MGELLFTFCYGGSLIMMGFVIKRVLKNTLSTHASLETDREEEEAL